MAGLIPLLTAAADPRDSLAGEPSRGGGLVPPAEADFVRERFALMQAAAAVRSADGRVFVAGNGLSASGKLTLLGFVEDVRVRASRLLGAPFEGSAFSIGVHVRPGERDVAATLDLRVDISRDPAILLTVRNPESVDAPDMAERLCVAFLGVDALVAGNVPGRGRGPTPTPYPGWFGAGLARLLDVSARQDDAEGVLARWSAGGLPCFEVLAADFSPYASSDAALSAQLVAWFLDTPDRRSRYERLRRSLGQGRSWAPALLEAVAEPGDSPLALDARWDAWLLSRRWTVLSPGTTHPALVARTRDQVRVWPGSPGTPLGVLPVRRAMEPAELVARRTEPWVAATAAMQAAAMQRLGGGRGGAYRRVAESYAVFFDALRRRASEAVLARRLAEAEALLVEVETGVRP